MENKINEKQYPENKNLLEKSESVKSVVRGLCADIDPFTLAHLPTTHLKAGLGNNVTIMQIFSLAFL